LFPHLFCIFHRKKLGFDSAPFAYLEGKDWVPPPSIAAGDCRPLSKCHYYSSFVLVPSFDFCLSLKITYPFFCFTLLPNLTFPGNMENTNKRRGERGQDTCRRKRRTNAEIRKDTALAVQARTNRANLFARSGFIIPQGGNIAIDESTDDPTVAVQAPTRKDYDEINNNDDFDGDDDDDAVALDVCDEDAESYCPTETLMGWYITALKKEISQELKPTAKLAGTWLVRHLQLNGFIVRAESAQFICNKLNID
jgi:hypothetical protein